MSTTLVLVRHAHPDITAGREVMAGWFDVPLSARGRQEAEALARALSAGGGPLYVSSSRRARETAQALGRAAEAAIVRDDLREIHCGILEGWPVARVRETHPELWSANERQDDDAFRWPGGESYAEFRARSLWALRSIADAHPGGRVLVVTHAGVINQAVGHVRGSAPACWSAFRPAPASITELSWNGGPVRILRFDDRRHLEAG